MDKKYRDFEKLISVKFKNKNLLDQAFVHKSYVNEASKNKEHNERLEFLGDAVLELVVTEFLFANYNRPEGELTNFRSALVRGANLAEIARKLNLGQYLYLGKGEEKSGGRQKGYILANSVEALIGAIFLDQGYKKCHEFITKFIVSYLGEILAKGLDVDPKSRLQEIAQSKFNVTPIYKLISESGPDHSKIFVMGVFIGEEKFGEGTGSSKQQAEQNAAADAIEKKKYKMVDGRR
ncbi:MAG: ribonuclease III, ribonuclease III [Candidatus Peregrinibacteria bacterium GW2011_GWF2_43_17]|nr:MAG: ribonuclease III, ribonuclease III [Candidatus Peregrinibacteria bacterium GW2011_GWF2_43_17]KKT20240.1 MAG: Ribonuclease 3 [Candidatus Peregrinibacteria bacterium GW2011_GWA2_43_8]HAU39800.1 ribonuclease III [Candidatus Peregrinibacteria bacterium]